MQRPPRQKQAWCIQRTDRRQARWELSRRGLPAGGRGAHRGLGEGRWSRWTVWIWFCHGKLLLWSLVLFYRRRNSISQPWAIALRFGWDETFSEILTNHPTQFSGRSPGFRVSKVGCNGLDAGNRDLSYFNKVRIYFYLIHNTKSGSA